MKSFAIFFLILFILVHSDDNLDYLPPEIQSYMKDLEKCREGEDKESSCFSLSSSLQNRNYQCCIFILNSETPECFILGGSIADFKKMKNSEKAKALLKEMAGYYIYGLPYDIDDNEDSRRNDIKNSQNYKCQDGEETIFYGYDNYSSDDKNRIQSDKHCLKYYYAYATDMNYKNNKPTKDQCFNAELLQSSKDAGLKCGFYEFHLKFLSGKTEIYTACYIYDPDIIKTKTIDDNTKSNFDNIGNQFTSSENDQFVGYTVDFWDSEGNKLSYDPLTGKVESSSSNSKRIKIQSSIYLLFLLILIFV